MKNSFAVINCNLTLWIISVLTYRNYKLHFDDLYAKELSLQGSILYYSF